jgi:hypothetical protein
MLLHHCAESAISSIEQQQKDFPSMQLWQQHVWLLPQHHATFKTFANNINQKLQEFLSSAAGPCNPPTCPDIRLHHANL